MNEKPLVLTAPRPETIGRFFRFLALTAVGTVCLFWLHYASVSDILPDILCCALFVPLVFLTAGLFCGAADAIICLFDKKAVVLTDTEIKVYNLPALPLEEIEEMTLLPAGRDVKRTLVLKARDGRTVKILRRTVNLPLPLLREAILLRKNNGAVGDETRERQP